MLAMERDTRNGTGPQELDDECTNIYFTIGDRMEIASFRSDQVTNKEIRELFRSAAEAGPLDIVKLRKGDKILNISLHLPSNTPDDPYILQVVGIHPVSTGMVEADLMRTLERRVATLERQLRDYHEAASTTPSIALQELKTHVDTFRNKLETIEHLSWLGFYKQLPEPISSEACRRLQYRRKSDSVKRKVREKFLNICDVAISSSVREWLRSPSFDARQWEDEELLLMLQTMFIELDLPQKFNISMATLRNFLYEVYNNYNEVPFHNFRHCFCVAQMMYAMAWAVDLPTKIGHLEMLVLIVSSICHDLDHPGYNNIYQINARTELALRYNDISPLENHHCSVSFRVLESPECNILSSLDSSTYRTVREGIIRCILATDMARHNEILGQFTEITPEFDYSNIAHINLLSMVLIKVADISNEARPLDVAEPWLDNLLQEFFKQSDAEKLEGLPVTPFMDRDKVTKPSSQVSFIGLVLMPLFEALGELFPELQELIVEPAHYALDYYRRLHEAAKDERHQRKSIVDLNSGMSDNASAPSGGVSGSSSHSVVKSTSSHSMRSKRSGGTVHSRSRSTEDDAAENLTIEEIENIESSDPETATEVEVSEKTLKFKISTDVTAPSTGRKSYPGSRKGSREKSSLDYQNHELAKAMREHERRRSRADNLNSNLSSPVSARSNDDSRILEELERDEILYVEAEGNGQLPVGRRSIGKRALSVEASSATSPERCCCDDKTSASHRSLFSRLRNLTDRLSMSFDTTKEPPVGRPVKLQSKSLSKCNSIGSPSAGRRAICKRCNLVRIVKERSVDADKRSMTLPKTRRAQDCLNKSWRNVFVKERRPSISLEVLATSEDDVAVTSKHRRNRSNPEGNVAPVEFHEIDVRTCKPDILVEKVNPGFSSALDRDDDTKVEIRRSSASMEDISKITKQNELTLSSLDQKKVEDLQHTGSLDSMLHKESTISKIKKPTFSSPVASKKSTPSLFSRFKSGMSIDGSKSHSNSSSLHDQQSPSGWISSLTASFRPKRQTSGSAAESTSASPHPPLSPNHDEIK